MNSLQKGFMNELSKLNVTTVGCTEFGQNLNLNKLKNNVKSEDVILKPNKSRFGDKLIKLKKYNISVNTLKQYPLGFILQE